MKKFKPFITLLAAYFAFVAFPVLSHAQEHKSREVKLVPYFAGKDETCLRRDANDSLVSQKYEKVRGTLATIFHVTDVHGKTDKESHCTLYIQTDQNKRSKPLALSVGGARCEEILQGKEIGTPMTFFYYQDHLCDYRK